MIKKSKKTKKGKAKEEKQEVEDKDEKIEEQTKPEGKEKAKEEMPLLDEPIKVKDYIYMTIISLDAKAWAYMDFVVHPETQKHMKDMNEAKRAIDAIDALFKIIEDQLSPEQKKDFQTRITNLKLNFAKK